MLLELIKAIGGLVLVMAAWLIVQAYLRRRLSAGPDADILHDMAHSCGGCSRSGQCSGSNCESPKRKPNEMRRP